MEIKFNLPKIKPIWVAWVTGQFLFCLGVMADSGVISQNRGQSGLLLAGLSVLLDCIIIWFRDPSNAD